MGRDLTERLAVAVFAGIVSLGWATFALGLEQPTAEATTNAISSATEAEVAAVRFLGYSARERPGLEASLERGGEGASVPFLDTTLRDQDFWHVVVSGAPLRLASNTPGFPAHEVTLDVYMEAESGRLTAIVSRWPADRPEGLPVSPAASQAERTHRGDDETWVSLAPADPKLTFMQALDEVQQQGGEIRETGRIVAYFIEMTRLQHPEPLPVWSIHLYGIPPAPCSIPASLGPVPPDYDPVPEYVRDHMRYVVDDATGKCLFLTTTPQPDIPPGWTWDKKTRSWNRPPEPEAKPGADGDEHSASTPSENPNEPEGKR